VRDKLGLLAVGFALAVPGSAVAGEAEPLTIEHIVAPGESLWSIAAQSDVYADPYLWPVIYKFNRDQIVDPSRIYPNQRLQIPTRVDEGTRSEARASAGAQPQIPRVSSDR
jgi:nucleoid-associated protein YgaU